MQPCSMNGFGAVITLSGLQPLLACQKAGGYWDVSTQQCLASKPSAIPTWGWIAGGAVIVGTAAYFFLLK
jgi:hypothetical protein